MKYFVIICRKRSDIIGAKGWVYWKPNQAGYTGDRNEAGIYSSSDLDECAGDGKDWFAQPLYWNESGEK